jgi:Fur family transcriptional regulator, ferric uptake regulator
MAVLPMDTTYNSASLRSELHERGCRMTPQREEILNVFQELDRGKHLSAEELHEILAGNASAISLSTVYRTVKLMARMGILRELELAEGHKHYEINQPAPYHHHHLICVRCSRTIEFRSDSILKVGSKAAEKEGFQLLDCQLAVHAVCPKCQRSLV